MATELSLSGGLNRYSTVPCRSNMCAAGGPPPKCNTDIWVGFSQSGFAYVQREVTWLHFLFVTLCLRCGALRLCSTGKFSGTHPGPLSMRGVVLPGRTGDWCRPYATGTSAGKQVPFARNCNHVKVQARLNKLLIVHSQHTPMLGTSPSNLPGIPA